MIAFAAAYTVSPQMTQDDVIQLMDNFADLDEMCDDLLDWSIGASLGEQRIEIEATLDADTVEAAQARGLQLIELAVGFTGGQVPHMTDRRTERVEAERIPA